MKIIFMIFGFAVCALTGVYIKNRFQKKEKLLNDFIYFCESTKAQIAFLQTGLDKLIETEIKKYKGEFVKVLESFSKYLKEGIPLEKTKNITEEEWIIMFNMFEKLGRSDVKNQVALCENTKLAITPLYESAKDKNKSEGNMWLKLMFCAGFALVIILL